ncbi:hypothetical protein Tco_0060867 [Tanacetum coccineum]
MRKLFRTSCFGKWLDLAYFDHEPHMIDYMLQKQCYVNDSHYDMPLIFYVHGRGLHFGHRQFSLITGLRYEEVIFTCYIKGDLNFRFRVFPHRVGLNITSLDLIRVIEDEEFFSKLCDEDVVRVCLLLSIEVIFMGRMLVHEFDDTLMSNRWSSKDNEVIPRGLAWSRKAIFKSSDYSYLFCKESNPTIDLRPTLAEYLIEGWTCNNEFLKNYIPRTPNRRPDIFEAFLLKVVSGHQRKKYARIMTTSIPTMPRSKISMLKDRVITYLNSRIFKLEAIILVLVREINSRVVEKLEFNKDFCNLSIEFCDELNKEFLELFEPPSCSSGSGCLDLDINEDADEDYLLQEQFRLKLEEEEMLLFKEEKIMEEESMFRLEEEARAYEQAIACVVPKKRSHCTCVTSSSWLKVSSKFKDKSQGRCVIHQDMTEFLKNVKPWFEDLSRCNTSIDNVWLTEDLDLYLGQPGLLRCRFPWCNDRTVNRKFWESLVCLDPLRKGWLLDEMLLQNSMPDWYANGQTYNLPWSEVDQFDIRSGLVTFYDRGDTYAIECREWYIRTMDCLQNEVMLRRPVKSLLHFRIVSKTWKSIIDSTEFVVSYGARPS